MKVLQSETIFNFYGSKNKIAKANALATTLFIHVIGKSGYHRLVENPRVCLFCRLYGRMSEAFRDHFHRYAAVEPDVPCRPSSDMGRERLLDTCRIGDYLQFDVVLLVGYDGQPVAVPLKDLHRFWNEDEGELDPGLYPRSGIDLVLSVKMHLGEVELHEVGVGEARQALEHEHVPCLSDGPGRHRRRLDPFKLFHSEVLVYPRFPFVYPYAPGLVRVLFQVSVNDRIVDEYLHPLVYASDGGLRVPVFRPPAVAVAFLPRVGVQPFVEVADAPLVDVGERHDLSEVCKNGNECLVVLLRVL